MSQPSVASYFNTRKRTANEDLRLTHARKVLLLNENDTFTKISNINSDIYDEKISKVSDKQRVCSLDSGNDCVKIVTVDRSKTVRMAKRAAAKQKTRSKTIKHISNQRNIEEVLNNMSKDKLKECDSSYQTDMDDLEKTHQTPPSTPTKKINAMDKIPVSSKEPSLLELKKSLTRSSRLAELKASLGRFKDLSKRLDDAEKQTEKVATSPSLKAFKTIELEVTSPSKIRSPEKSYLSPKKDLSVRKNLLNLLSPTKAKQEVLESPKKVRQGASEKSSLTLPFKYRRLAEIFRSIDTVCQILYNRRELITFKKLKPAVEEMLKRNLYEKHLSQIKHLCPDFFNFNKTKLKTHCEGGRQEKWELVISPNIDRDTMSVDLLLLRRRKFYNTLLEKVKLYHNEFLLALDPPLDIPLGEVNRWHPEFDIEKLPDIECAELPPKIKEEKIITGKEILEKARVMFNCNNTRMEQALERLGHTTKNNLESVEKKSVCENTLTLKGIPKALLEKVREKQAAKALESMTRSVTKEKEVQLYSRLPDIARHTRNIFVVEKRSVLHIDAVIEKLSNSFRTYMTKSDLENHLRIISKEVPTWLTFHEIRQSTFIKISKNEDLNLIIDKLQALITEKTSS